MLKRLRSRLWAIYHGSEEVPEKKSPWESLAPNTNVTEWVSNGGDPLIPGQGVANLDHRVMVSEQFKDDDAGNQIPGDIGVSVFFRSKAKTPTTYKTVPMCMALKDDSLITVSEDHVATRYNLHCGCVEHHRLGFTGDDVVRYFWVSELSAVVVVGTGASRTRAYGITMNGVATIAIADHYGAVSVHSPGDGTVLVKIGDLSYPLDVTKYHTKHYAKGTGYA